LCLGGEKLKTSFIITYEYDKANYLAKTILTDRRNRTTVFEHDREERLRRITNPLGHSVRFTHDISGNLTSVIDPNGNTRSFKYDGNGNPILIRDAMGNEWKQEFDELSRLTSITDPIGRTASLTYEGDKLVSVKTPEGVIRYEYDKRGNITKITDVNDNSIEFTPRLDNNERDSIKGN
jgi:YD repeat-containing protein